MRTRIAGRSIPLGERLWECRRRGVLRPQALGHGVHGAILLLRLLRLLPLLLVLLLAGYQAREEHERGDGAGEHVVRSAMRQCAERCVQRLLAQGLNALIHG